MSGNSGSALSLSLTRALEVNWWALVAAWPHDDKIDLPYNEKRRSHSLLAPKRERLYYRRP